MTYQLFDPIYDHHFSIADLKLSRIKLVSTKTARISPPPHIVTSEICRTTTLCYVCKRSYGIYQFFCRPARSSSMPGVDIWKYKKWKFRFDVRLSANHESGCSYSSRLFKDYFQWINAKQFHFSKWGYALCKNIPFTVYYQVYFA